MALGRYLADTMSVVPRFSRAEFERLYNESVQDAVMVSYLANLMRAQVCCCTTGAVSSRQPERCRVFLTFTS
jgi:hypothetical protein